MKMSLAQETTVVCTCCGNKVKTIWAFEQEMVAGHSLDGEPISGQGVVTVVREARYCLGGYSAAEHHRSLDFDAGES